MEGIKKQMNQPPQEPEPQKSENPVIQLREVIEEALPGAMEENPELDELLDKHARAHGLGKAAGAYFARLDPNTIESRRPPITEPAAHLPKFIKESERVAA